jgi:K+-transporting ATPase ATPase A chain
MLLGRFVYIVAVLVIAGTMVRKQRRAVSLGTFPVEGGTFGGMFAGVVVIVGVLTFLPAVALGPVVEHLVRSGQLF